MNQDRLQTLVDRISEITPNGRRSLIAISGPPASGKSRLAAQVVDALNHRRKAAVLVPMDGFHLDNTILEARGLLARKGAPETFDGQGFVHAIRRMRDEDDVILPTFDRAADLSIAGAINIGPQDLIAVVEGNYLCFEEPPWSDLADLWDLSIYIDVPEQVLLDRLIKRWVKYGLSPADAEMRARSNDLANAQRISNASGGYDISVTSD